MTQVNITQISNGFLVATQPSINPVTQRPTQGTVQFFSELTDALAFIKTLFPADLG